MRADVIEKTKAFVSQTVSTFGLPLFWPYASIAAAAELFRNSLEYVHGGTDVRFGDGKPVVLVPGHLAGDVTLQPLSMWLHAIGYRPAKSNVLINVDDRHLDEPLSLAVRTAAQRVGRKAVILALDTGLRAAARVAKVEQDFVSDVIAVGLPDKSLPQLGNVRLHVIENAWRTPPTGGPDVHLVRGTRALLAVNPESLRIMSRILRDIPITLLDADKPV